MSERDLGRLAHWPVGLWRLVLSRRAPHDSEAAMFVGIRRRLTLWYGAVLGTVLILFGVALYVVENQALLRPINDNLASKAGAVREAWQAHPTAHCPGTAASVRYWACFAPNGTIVNHSNEIDDAPNFPSRSFALSALHVHSKSDTINGGLDAGMLRRYAQVVRRPGHGILGLIVVATGVQGELDALRVLLTLLFIFGACAVLAGTIGGLFLSGRALAPARAALRRQQEFIADASHELRTPLSLVRADADLLKSERNRLTEQGAMLLDDIVLEVTYMGALSANLLTLTELGSRALQLDRDVVDLADIARSMAQRSSAFAAASGVSVHSVSTASVLVIGDRLLLEQATLILMENAIKYNWSLKLAGQSQNPAGRRGGTVHITARSADDRAILEVADTGIGIAPQHLAHLGERFYRVDKSRSREAGGAGLGLSIAQGIAGLHGGRIVIDSTEGTGTTVSLVLPLATASGG